MPWSAWANVVVLTVAAVLGGVGASSRSLLVNQGYEDVVVGLSPLLDERQAEDIISALKDALNETSQALFKATGNRLYFKRVKVLIPSTWSKALVDQPAINEDFENSDMRVEVRNPVYGDQVYTVQPGGCGEPGHYIHLTSTYLTSPAAENAWGPRGKVLAQEWARLRWGVFDEVGFPEDQLFPLFYRAWNDQQKLVVKPNHCADEEIVGSYVDELTQGSCRYVDGFPDENCRFVPDEKQTATSSLMSFTDLESIEEFCEDEGAEVRRHNADAPNRHNLMCEGRSVWAVMADHHDFLNTSPLPADHPVAPEVLVVQQAAATFALVLDHSGSMDGQKISVLVNSAKRWLLYDVADGSFVTIINFSNSATVIRTVTEVSNNTRQGLADAINSDVSGGTCIGCGLRKALQEMGNKSNKVILLITDGEENVKPSIDDVMDEVVQSGTRVVTISYGMKAEITLEKLAQNTGGKTFLVPKDDDGSFMDDAFKGSLTYQPGQTLSNTNIKIYEWEGSIEGTEIDGTFPVDATVGRNLEFRVDSAVETKAPFLTSPSGQNFTDANFNREINLWVIKVDMAEVGMWTWAVTTNTPRTRVKITVTAQARGPEVLPIYTKSWMNTGVDFVDASQQTVIVYAKVTQGENPVVGAKVRAYITTPSTTDEAVELDLLDNGQNADVQAGDGIYSRYFTQFVATGRYAVKAQVWDEGSSYINNGFITSRRKRRRALRLSQAFSRFSYDQLVVPEYCCGSVVPFNPETATPTGEFTRTVAAGSFNVVAMPEGGDSFPPARVKDLSTHTNDTSLLTLRWTAPGDDYDAGTVSGYEIWMSRSAASLNKNMDENNVTSLLDYETSALMTELLQEAGTEITLKLELKEALEADTLYFVALKAVDDVGNRSPLSTPVRLVASASSPGGGGVKGLKAWVITLMAVGCILASL